MDPQKSIIKKFSGQINWDQEKNFFKLMLPGLVNFKTILFKYYLFYYLKMRVTLQSRKHFLKVSFLDPHYFRLANTFFVIHFLMDQISRPSMYVCIRVACQSHQTEYHQKIIPVNQNKWGYGKGNFSKKCY